MSVKYNNKNGVLQNISGLTPGGDLSFGAVTTRSGNTGSVSVVVGYQPIDVTFSESMPDSDYEVVLTLDVFPANGGGDMFAAVASGKNASGFTILVYNSSSSTQTVNITWKAFKLYDVADAEALYSDVTDIKSYIPSNASSSNKLSTANDLRTETRTLDRRLDDVEDVIPDDASITNKLVTQDDLSGVEIDKVEDINDVDLTSIQDGQTLIWDATNSKWVNGQGGKVYSAGNGINISGTDEISTNTDNTSVVIGNNKELKVADTYKTTFVGTTAAWNALSAVDKAKYSLVTLTDDSNGTGVVDDVIEDDYRAVTSNAVYEFFNNLFPNITIYDNGEEPTYTLTQSTSGTSSHGDSVTRNASNIVFSSSFLSGVHFSFGFLFVPLDFTFIKKVKLKLSAINITGTQGARFCVSSSNRYDTAYANAIKYVTLTNGTLEYEIDTSDIAGSYYLGIAYDGANDAAASGTTTIVQMFAGWNI